MLNGTITVYDAVMALIVFYTTVQGFWKGATWQIAPIMSLVLGYMVAMPMSVTMAHYFGDPPHNRLFALVSIYIGVALIVFLMFRSFRAGIDKAKLTEFDRHIGAMLGLVKGVLLTLAITVGLLIYSTAARDIILKSESSTIAAKIINTVYPILPQAMHDILRPYLNKLDGELPLDLHASDVNSDVVPEHDSPLKPTASTARVRSADTGESPRRRVRSFVDDDEQELPEAPPPRRRTPQYDDRNQSAPRRYDSAQRTDHATAVEDRQTSSPNRNALVPTRDEEDDPFVPRSSSTRLR